jgi:hypothetical protein
MVNAYKLGKLIFEWDSDLQYLVATSDPSHVCAEFYSEQAILDAGATPIENESEEKYTKDNHEHTFFMNKNEDWECEKCHLLFTTIHCGIEPGREDENTKEEHEKIKGYVLSKAVREAEREEIKMPEYLGNVLGRQVEATNAMNDWMQSVTDMLNRHEQLLREGK